APADRTGSFNYFSDDEELVDFVGSVTQCFFGGEPVARLIFAKHVEDWNCVSSRFDMADIDFAQLFGVFQNVGQLLLEKSRFVLRQIESRQFRHVSDVEIRCFCHKLKVEMIKQPNCREQEGHRKNQK